MKSTLIKNATLVNEGERRAVALLIEGERVARIWPSGQTPDESPFDEVIDATGQYLLPGAIDEHVHFREPGMTRKGDIATESRAAAAGGVTSIMDMPNTSPQTITLEAWERKMALMAERSVVNYSAYFGATNQNYDLFPLLDKRRVCGVKLFMGASTGDMLVDRIESLRRIFGGTDLLIAAHCEDQNTIRENTEYVRKEYIDVFDPRYTEEDLEMFFHSVIRSDEACYLSSELAVRLAQEAGARLHIMHISTARELELFSDAPLARKRITAEVCVPHLIFDDYDYSTFGARIKCNPAIKSTEDREALRAAVDSGRVDSIATDHAPHLLADKEGGPFKAASGMPSVQFSLVAMLNLFSVEKVVEKMAHAPALMYGIQRRGFVREGYQADLVLVRPGGSPWTLTADQVLSKCGWSPYEGRTFHWTVERTFVNGNTAYAAGNVDDTCRGQELAFDH
ncbi:MAG: dihydroorotase [Mediterranea sp.]|jgi:dihydroorotase|nr:dihydroorotase [Mediterranea sp.]